MKKLFIFLLMPLLVLSFTACEEEDETSIGTPSEEDLQPIEDNTKAETGVMNAANYMNPYGLDEDLSGKKSVADNPTYSLDGNTLTIDFTGVDGMGGTIIIEYNSDPLDTPFTLISAVAQLNDYMEGGTTYNGTLTFSMTVEDNGIQMTVATPDGEELQIEEGNMTSTWSGQRIMTWTAGINTPADPVDDIYEVTGSSEGLTSNQTNYTSDILQALVFSPNCDYIMSGEQQIKNYVGTEDETTLTLTYHVDANGNELDEPTCNPYFNLNFVSSNLELNLVLNLENM